MSIEAYIKSRAAFVAVEDELTEIMRVVSAVADGLRYRRERVNFKGTATSLPEGAAPYANETKDAAEWPTAERIMERLSLWHSRRATVKADWAALGKDEQAALQPPPEAATGSPKRY